MFAKLALLAAAAVAAMADVLPVPNDVPIMEHIGLELVHRPGEFELAVTDDTLDADG